MLAHAHGAVWLVGQDRVILEPASAEPLHSAHEQPPLSSGEELKPAANEQVHAPTC